MSNEKTDEELITQYKNGGQEVFLELINRYTSPLYNFVARLIGRNDTPDIVQEIFIKVWKNINRFDSEKANFKTWIFSIAKNTTIDFLRKKRNILFSDIPKDTEGELDSFEERIPDNALLPEEALLKLENEQFLNETLEKLPENYREILILRYQEEMTFDEIGKILNKPLNTVKSQHRRAMIKLRKIIE